MLIKNRRRLTIMIGILIIVLLWFAAECTGKDDEHSPFDWSDGYSVGFNIDICRDFEGSADYDIFIYGYKNKLFSIEYNNSELGGIRQVSWQVEGMYEWKHLKLSVKDFRRSRPEETINEINILGRYGNHYGGVVLLWQNNIPSQAIKYGVEYHKKYNFLLSQPELFLSMNTITNDFKDFKKELTLRGKINLFTFGKIGISYSILTRIFQYDKFDWQVYTGASLEF